MGEGGLVLGVALGAWFRVLKGWGRGGGSLPIRAAGVDHELLDEIAKAASFPRHLG